MNDDALALLGVLGAVTLCVLSLGPVPELGFVLQFSGVGALAGTALGLRERYRSQPAKRTTVVAVGALVGALFGGLLVLAEALLAGLR